MVISADIFAVLLRYFWSSIENLMINKNYGILYIGKNRLHKIHHNLKKIMSTTLEVQMTQ